MINTKAKPCKLKFTFKVQVPTVVNELTSFVYRFVNVLQIEWR